jgi:phospholipase/carboxylesterase
VAALISHSGMLIGPEHLEAEIRSRPPVLLTHGAADEVVPAEALPAAKAALEAAGVPVRTQLVPGLGHGIDDTTVRAALGFIGELVGGQGLQH